MVAEGSGGDGAGAPDDDARADAADDGHRARGSPPRSAGGRENEICRFFR